MDIDDDTKCPNCRGELLLRNLSHGDVAASCSGCQVAALWGDDRFMSTKDVSQKEVDARLCKRSEKIAEDRKLAEGRYTEVKR